MARLKGWAIPMSDVGGGASNGISEVTECEEEEVYSGQENGVFWEEGNDEQRDVIKNKIKNNWKLCFCFCFCFLPLCMAVGSYSWTRDRTCTFYSGSMGW